LVTGFIEHFQIVTTSNYSAAANLQAKNSLQHTLCLFSLLCLHQPGNGFQRQSFSLIWVSEISPWLSCHLQKQLIMTEIHFSNSLKNSSLPCTALTPRLAAISHQTPTLLINCNSQLNKFLDITCLHGSRRKHRSSLL
jgi:hypothetical protein